MYTSDEGIGPDGMPAADKKEGWSRAGILKAQSRSEVVGIQADFPKAVNYTAQFSLDASAAPVILCCEAELEWSVEGNTILRRISVTDGASVTGVGQGVQIRIRDFSPIAVPATVFNYKVAVSVAPGTRGSTSSPPFLADRPTTAGVSAVRQIAAAGFDVFAIPQGVGIKSIEVTIGQSAGGATAPIPEQSVQVIIMDQTGGVELVRYDPRSVQWQPMPIGAGFVRIENRQAVGTIDTMTFYGIDG